MTTIDLARHLMGKMGWSVADLAREVGVNRTTAYAALSYERRTERRGSFEAGVFRKALECGLVEEVWLAILQDNAGFRITTQLRAALMYPDLTPLELEQLLRAEEEIHMSPLSAEIIKSIISRARS